MMLDSLTPVAVGASDLQTDRISPSGEPSHFPITRCCFFFPAAESYNPLRYYLDGIVSWTDVLDRVQYTEEIIGATRDDEPRPVWTRLPITHYVFITAGPSTKLFACVWGGGYGSVCPYCVCVPARMVNP
jgi:hypothetical protein